ncbi:MAG: lytic transglycosylase domain-containing protein [Ilumatobacteraceae bacterium]
MTVETEQPTSVATTTLTPTTATVGVRLTGDLSAEQLALELTEVERIAARGDGGVGRRQQLLYRYLSAHVDLDEAVLAAVGDDVRPFVERIIRARQLGQARQAANTDPSPPSDTLPAWVVVEPLPVEQLLTDYRAAEQLTGVGWYWLAAIHFQETRTGRIIGSSSAGAVGPMQFLPSTWALCCTGDPMFPHDAIVGAATYLAQGGGPGDMQSALHTYNPNDSYVATVTAFAENLRDNPQLYHAYREWQVFYTTSAGTIRLPIGYSQPQPIDAVAYLADHPDDGTA